MSQSDRRLGVWPQINLLFFMALDQGFATGQWPGKALRGLKEARFIGVGPSQVNDAAGYLPVCDKTADEAGHVTKL